MALRLLPPTFAFALLAGCTAPLPPSPPPTAAQPTRQTARPTVAAATSTPPPTSTPSPPTVTPVPPSPTQTSFPRPRASLQDTLQAAVERHPGTIGVVVTRLTDGDSASVNADKRFRSASLYKLFVLDAAMDAVDGGRLTFDETLTVTAREEQLDPYLDLDVGARISVGCALQTMIAMSGNAAADLLLKRVSLAAVDSRIKALGLAQSVISDESAFTSPADIGRVLERIARGQLVNAAASQYMLDLLGEQQHNDRIPMPLPLNVHIAHKTGEWSGVRNDAGVIFAPSGQYVLVIMVQGAPSESDARAAIVDISKSVYTALEPGDLATYLGLPPRLARQVLATADAQGRLPLLGDPRTETARLPAEVEVTAEAEGDAQRFLRARSEITSDLLALQHAAGQAGAPFWVRSAFRQLTDAEAGKTVPTEWLMPCAVEQPPLVADRLVQPADVAAAEAQQAWLGTVVWISDEAAGVPTTADDASSTTGHWLAAHAATYGFVPALAETPMGKKLGREPWAWRWVGREMAVRLAPLAGSPTYSARALERFQQAQAELSATDPDARRPTPWGLADRCWTIAISTSRGCPSRWYFLPISWT